MLWLWRVCLVLGLVFLGVAVAELIAGWGHPWLFVYPASMFLVLALSQWLRQRPTKNRSDTPI
jgi:hypothetical protein